MTLGPLLRWGLVAALACLAGCTPRLVPEPLTQADRVAESPAARDADEHAPQAATVARGLLREAHDLEKAGATEEAAVVGEEALAAFEEAFALARAARALARATTAKRDLEKDELKLAELEQEQARSAREADSLEMRVNVALDRETVKDVETLTPERAIARRQAALELASEARLLCVAARLLGSRTSELDVAEKTALEVDTALGQGAIDKQIYPRAAAARTACLKELTGARRPHTAAAPEIAGSDRLLSELAATEILFAFKDDRGVVVNLRTPTGKAGALTEAAEKSVELLARTAKEHPEFPLLIVGHGATQRDDQKAREAAEAIAGALERAGVPRPRIESVGSRQPAVDSRVSGAASLNFRVEVIFVTLGR